MWIMQGFPNNMRIKRRVYILLISDFLRVYISFELPKSSLSKYFKFKNQSFKIWKYLKISLHFENTTMPVHTSEIPRFFILTLWYIQEVCSMTKKIRHYISMFFGTYLENISNCCRRSGRAHVVFRRPRVAVSARLLCSCSSLAVSRGILSAKWNVFSLLK